MGYMTTNALHKGTNLKKLDLKEPIATLINFIVVDIQGTHVM